MKRLIALFFVFTGILSCTNDFEEINTNENLPTTAAPGNILPGVLFNSVDVHDSFNTNVTDALMQFMVNIDGGSQYDFRNGFWGEPYAAFTNIQELEQQAESDPSLLGYAIVGKIMRAYNIGLLTELYVDVPFSEAATGLSGNVAPAYDRQEDIFMAILDELEEANVLINDGLQLAQGGDLIYSGDLSKWKKLTNSLRLRYLLKASEVMDVSQQMQEIVSNPDLHPILESNADDALLDYTGEIPFLGAFDVFARSQYEIRVPSTHYVELLSPSNDPRLDFFYSRPLNPAITEHVGGGPGLAGSDFDSEFPQGSFSLSTLNLRFFETRGLIDYAIMTFTELNFILAEAALKGLISGSAEEYYNQGVLSSLEYWGLEVPENFLNQPGVAWDNTLERLIDQKWAASFKVFNFESWSDYKRLGLPAFDLPVLAFPSTDGQIPTRMIYPITEQTLNTENYQAASQRIGGDNSLSRHWYTGNE